MHSCEMFQKNYIGIRLDIFNYMFVNYFKTFTGIHTKILN
jgi:hypothetical protein